MASVLGIDFFCFTDCDPQFRTVEGLPVVVQWAFHRLTTDSLINAAGWGKDVRNLVGRADTDETAAALGPQLAAVLQQGVVLDDGTEQVSMIEAANVVVTRAIVEGLGDDFDLVLTVDGQTAAGPFAFVMGVGKTVAQIIG